MSHYDIYQKIKRLIPDDLLEKYDHLCYGEMAEVGELSPWADDLRRAEREWNRIRPEGFA